MVRVMGIGPATKTKEMKMAFDIFVHTHGRDPVVTSVEDTDMLADVLERLATHFESRAHTRFSSKANISDSIKDADLVIGAVLIPGAAAPKLVTRDMLKLMKPGSVLVDVAIDPAAPRHTIVRGDCVLHPNARTQVLHGNPRGRRGGVARRDEARIEP
jgi:hypothetical protein